MVAHAPADGYTLLLVNLTHAINATLYEKLNYNFARDIEPVAAIHRRVNVVEIHPSMPAKTLPEFIAYAKANPGKIQYGFARQRQFVPHGRRTVQDDGRRQSRPRALSRPRPAMTDLLGGQLQVIFATTPGTTEYVRIGKLNALAVTTAQRADALPDVPTVASSCRL